MYNTERTFPGSHKTDFRPGQKTKEDFNILICEIRSIWTMFTCTHGVGAEMDKTDMSGRKISDVNMQIIWLLNDAL
jgi:hypothetical protein